MNLNKYEKNKYFKEFNLEKYGFNELIELSFKLLKLSSFFTISYKLKEVRSWLIENKTKIINGANMIHSHFKKKFICAEVKNFTHFFDNNKKWSIKSKNDEILDGDIIYFRFNS